MTHSSSHYDNRHYVIISSGDAQLVDFDQVLETSINTVRYSLDGTLTFVKYEGDMPPSVSGCTSKSQEYSHGEILDILSGDDWTPSGEFV